MSTPALPQIAGCPLPDPALSFVEQDPIVLLAMCIFGEARGGIPDERIGVGCVVRNRVRRGWHGRTDYPSVILMPYQFSCFLPDDPNAAKLLKPLEFESAATWDDCYVKALAIYHDITSDNTRGAVFYFSPPIKYPPKVWGNVEFTVHYGRTANTGTWFFTA